jgi:hypothetical protein
MFTKLIVVNGIHDHAGEPPGLRPASGHDSLRELSKGVTILLGSLPGNLQGAFGVGIVGGQQDSALGFHRQDAIAAYTHALIWYISGDPRSAAKAIQISADANTLGAYIANSVYAGRAAEARQAAGRLLKLQPDFRASHGRESLPSRSPEVREQIVAAFRTAGLPD